MDIAGAIKEIFGTARAIMHRVWGDRTSEQSRLESQLDELQVQKRLARERRDLATLNALDADERRLREEIAAKYPGR